MSVLPCHLTLFLPAINLTASLRDQISIFLSLILLVFGLWEGLAWAFTLSILYSFCGKCFSLELSHQVSGCIATGLERDSKTISHPCVHLPSCHETAIHINCNGWACFLDRQSWSSTKHAVSLMFSSGEMASSCLSEHRSSLAGGVKRISCERHQD